VDGAAFGPTEGLLQIGTRETSGAGRLGVMLATREMDHPGALGVSNEGSTERNANGAGGAPLRPLTAPLFGTVDVQNGGVNVVLAGPETAKVDFATWRTVEATAPNKDDESSFVKMTEGALTFKIDGETIQGQVRGTGLREPMLRMGSTYAASFVGRRHASKMVRAQQAATGLYSFDGLWRSEDERVRELRLEEDQGRLAGRYSGESGRVVGTADGEWAGLELRLNGQEGRGFLRVVPGGLNLVGYFIWSGEITPKPLVLTRGLPPPIAGETVTNDDMKAARTLAIDLASVGKCRQAIESLEPIFERYRQEADAALIDQKLRVWDKEQYLIELSFALQPLIDCNFQLGNYNSLVKYLRAALAVRNESGREADMHRLLEDRIEQAGDHAASEANTLSSLVANIKDLHRALDLGGTGIDFERAEAVTVTSVAPGRPAAAAGIVAGDVLLAVDGNTLAGLDEASVTARLRGPTGSTVRVAIRRGDQQSEFRMVRDPINRLAPPRHDEIARALEEELAGLGRARAILDSLPTVADLTGTTGGPHALRSLQNDLAARAEDLLIIQRATLDRLHALYREQPDIVEHLDRVFRFLELSRSQRGQADLAEMRSAEVDENIASDLLKNRSGMAPAERGLLLQQFYIVASLSAASLAFADGARFIDRLEVEKRYQKGDDRTREAAKQLGSWLERWRQQLLTDSAKIGALEAGQLYYDDAVTVFLDLGAPEEALVMAEASRTRAFTDLIAGRIVQRERGAATVVGTAVLNEANAPPPTLAELKETVHKLGATTVEYHLLPDRLITWVISPTGRIEVRSIQLDRAELDRSASELLRLIETPIPGPPAPDTAVDALIAARDVQVRQLYKWLIAPIEALLPPSPTDTVAIIPHRDLFRVPFAALKDGTGRYLIERNPLVYESSITVAGYGSRSKEAERRSRPNMLALVNPKPLVGPNGQHLSYGPLDWTEANIGVLASRYGSNYISIKKGPEATLAALQQEAITHNVIYFATHGKASDSLDETFIALAGQALTVLDVFRGRLETHAELVILGACETGRGPVSGDGVNNLGRAFTYAGSASLLTTLWAVPERATLDFLNTFHEAWLGRGLSKVNAAREAQLALMAGYPMQIDIWAPMVMFGVE